MAQPRPIVEAGVENAGFHRVWLRIGLLAFGGPAGQIALMHRELVDRLRWLSDAEYLRALNFCVLLPGPEAQQLATWCGWRLRGWRGGLAAGLLFVLPGALAMAVLTGVYMAYGAQPAIAALFGGVQAAVIAVVAQALVRLARRTLSTALSWTLAAGAFIAAALFDAPFPLIVVAAALIGLWPSVGGSPPALSPPESRPAPASRSAMTQVRDSLRIALLWLAIWAAPIALAALLLGPAHPLAELGAFFAGVAAISFGGAYAAVAFVAQEVVAAQGWLTPDELIAGLALAEATPGPLTRVFQFVGGLAGARFDDAWPPALGAALGMAMALWTFFAPTFLWIFTFAPHLDGLTRRPALAGALAAVTASLVGVMASLALWFALHTLFADVGELRLGALRLWRPGGAFDEAAALIATVALILLVRLRAPLPLALALGAAAGLARWWLNAS